MFEVVLPALEELYQNSDRIVHFGPPVIQAKLKSNHIYCSPNTGFLKSSSMSLFPKSERTIGSISVAVSNAVKNIPSF